MMERTHITHGGTYHLSSYGGTHRLYGPGITAPVFLHCYHDRAANLYTWTHPAGQGQRFNDWRACINDYVNRLPVEARP